MKFILASSSPRRKELLSKIIDKFDINVKPINESIIYSTDPIEQIKQLSMQKAKAVYESLDTTKQADVCIISADTMILFNDKLIGKPKDEKDAIKILTKLSNNSVKVISAFTIISNIKRKMNQYTSYDSTTIKFYPMSKKEIIDYVNSKEPLDKAGAFAIQGLGSKYIKSIDGNYDNVVGLPVSMIYHHLCSLKCL